MTGTIFKKTICLSLLGHIAVFTLFSLSFGRKMRYANYSEVSFWGSVLLSSELVMNRRFSGQPASKEAFIKKADLILFANPSQDSPRLFNHYVKPQLALLPAENKPPFRQAASLTTPPGAKKEPSVTLYPNLPYSFLLYFKDRQIVHIELMFNIISDGKTKSIAVRRKIASGSLEADLLSMRYMNHYLFLQQSRFMPNRWQTVRIELSPRHD